MSDEMQKHIARAKKLFLPQQVSDVEFWFRRMQDQLEDQK